MLFLKPISTLKNTFAFWFIYFVIFCLNNISAQKIQSYDVVIYGGTSAGVSAAIQCSRMGKKVILIEPTNRIGGLTTGGLGKTDIENKQAIGGISREFYQKIKTYYLKPENWIWEKREDYKGVSYNTFEEDAMWAFEPSVALKVYQEMVKNESNIHIVYNQRLNRKTGIKKEKQVIKSIQMETGQIYQGKMFMDCTYEGDLMAASGVSYTVGRESNSQYGESLNGVQANNFNLTLQKKLSRNGIHHNFIEGVSPYLVKGNPNSGQILSFTKIMVQLHEAGNTTTLSHYLSLLDTAGLLTGIEKYANNTIRKRSSSPKFQVYNNALISAQSNDTFEMIQKDPAKWGRVVESAVGAHLLNQSLTEHFELSYWREGSAEVDFILKKRDEIIAIEVKSSKAAITDGMRKFKTQFSPNKMLLVGPDGLPWEQFLKTDIASL